MIKVFIYLFILLCVQLVLSVNYKCVSRNFISTEKNATKEVSIQVERFKFVLLRLQRNQRQMLQKVPSPKHKRQHVENLVNLFALVHRLTKEWTVIFATARHLGKAVWLPSLPDEVSDLRFSGMTGVIRLQEVYDISTEVLAGGKLQGAFPKSTLSASDCFEIGRYYFRLRQFRRAVDWLLAALHRSGDLSISTPRVLEYLHLAYCYKGDYKSSIEILKSIVELFPDFSGSVELSASYMGAATQKCSDIPKHVVDNIMETRHSVHFVEFYQMCRQRQHIPPNKDLRCRLLHYNQPQLRISPFKVEELYLDPPLLMFHDVIHEKEINDLKYVFHNKTRPAIYDYAQGTSVLLDTQYNVWMDKIDVENTLVRKLNLRTARMTNFKLHYGFDTMLASYGLSAEIRLHNDLGEHNYTIKPGFTRADYATIMYYLNNVDEGGQTMFPLLELVVEPVKGSALVWLNRLPDWSPNYHMMHCSCPILRGSKWIVTKWLHILVQDYPECVNGKDSSYKYYYL